MEVILSDITILGSKYTKQLKKLYSAFVCEFDNSTGRQGLEAMMDFVLEHMKDNMYTTQPEAEVRLVLICFKSNVFFAVYGLTTQGSVMGINMHKYIV